MSTSGSGKRGSRRALTPESYDETEEEKEEA
jgi:hypothetical protein